MRRIYKYVVPLMDVDVVHNVLCPANFVGAVMQNGAVSVYFEVETKLTETIPFALRVFGTGHDIPGGWNERGDYKHLATLEDRGFVWHLHERRR